MTWLPLASLVGSATDSPCRSYVRPGLARSGFRSITAGTNIGSGTDIADRCALSATYGRSRRHVKSCGGQDSADASSLMVSKPAIRATSASFSLVEKDRRRPAPVKTSKRRNGFELAPAVTPT